MRQEHLMQSLLTIKLMVCHRSKCLHTITVYTYIHIPYTYYTCMNMCKKLKKRKKVSEHCARMPVVRTVKSRQVMCK